MLKLNVRQGAKTMSNPNLNTSHVKVKPNAISNGFRYSEFKYISC